jgi:pilus assembly protein Flp/PilA
LFAGPFGRIKEGESEQNRESFPLKRRVVMLMKLRGRRGQGMTEYIIIVALIAIAAIGVVSLFGDNIRRLFGSSANALTGDESVENKSKEAKDSVIGHKGLKKFGDNEKDYK